MAGLLPARLADGVLWLTSQKENSLRFDDWWVLNLQPQSGFHQIHMADRRAGPPCRLRVIQLAQRPPEEHVVLCHDKLLFWKVSAGVGRDWRARTDVTRKWRAISRWWETPAPCRADGTAVCGPWDVLKRRHPHFTSKQTPHRGRPPSCSCRWVPSSTRDASSQSERVTGAKVPTRVNRVVKVSQHWDTVYTILRFQSGRTIQVLTLKRVSSFQCKQYCYKYRSISK